MTQLDACTICILITFQLSIEFHRKFDAKFEALTSYIWAATPRDRIRVFCPSHYVCMDGEF